MEIGNSDAVLTVDEADFEDQADADLTAQIIALSMEKTEIDYIRAHLGKGFFSEKSMSFLHSTRKNYLSANHAFELVTIFDASHPAIHEFRRKIKMKHEEEWSIGDLCKH